MDYPIGSDQWVLWLWNNYSIVIGVVLGAIKIVALAHPGVTSNSIVDLLCLLPKTLGIVKRSVDTTSDVK
jgi:hypothetical protein